MMAIALIVRIESGLPSATKPTQDRIGGSVENQSGECNCLEQINFGEMMEQIFSYDNNGNLTNITATNTPWLNQGFTYDVLNRMITALSVYDASATLMMSRETGCSRGSTLKPRPHTVTMPATTDFWKLI